MKRQSGFTLIELVMVIVILGVLAAVAIPKFVNLKGEAQTAALTGMVGSISSANSINYAVRSADSSKGVPTAGLACSQVVPSLLQGGLPSGWASSGTVAIAGSSGNCVVEPPNGAASAPVSIYGI